MILEVAILDVVKGKEDDFQSDFAEAQAIISSMKGYLSHELNRCIEKRSRYILLVRWNNIKDHTEGFRQSDEYARWKKMLHHYYSPFPVVEHYETIYSTA